MNIQNYFFIEFIALNSTANKAKKYELGRKHLIRLENLVDLLAIRISNDKKMHYAIVYKEGYMIKEDVISEYNYHSIKQFLIKNIPNSEVHSMENKQEIN